MPYAASLRRKPNAKYRRGPYRKRMPYGMPYPSARPRASISQGGVGGGQLAMKPGFQAPQEVKAYYTSITTAPSNNLWNVISPDTVVAGIKFGTGGNERIGRNIRIVGFTLRLSVNTQTSIPGNTGGEPYTVDLILDKRPNGAQATVSQIYATTDRFSLPNPNFVNRFVFLKRIEVSAKETPNSMINATVKLNRVANFEGPGTVGVITDLETCNIIVCASANDVTPNYQGSIAVMYVDA